VLKEVAYILRKELRAFDLAYRLGGEEFLVLVPGSSIEQTADLAERLRAAICLKDMSAGIGITMSLGASASEADEPFDYGRRLPPRADAALYRAKRGGRKPPSAAPRANLCRFAV